MCFSIAVVAYVLGTMVFERKAHAAVVNV
jgi:hypothetical protein